MARYYRRYNYYNDDYIEDPIAGLILLGLLYTVYKYYTDRTTFWHWVIYGIIIIVILILIFIIIKVLNNRRNKKIYLEIKKVNTDITKIVEEVKKETKTNTVNPPTRQARALYDALIARGIKCELEKWDGYKHIDIAIKWARMNVEIDGTQHYLDPKQVRSDYQRNYYSMRKGFKTIRYPNFVIERHLDQVADTIAQVARNEYYKNKH